VIYLVSAEYCNRSPKFAVGLFTEENQMRATEESSHPVIERKHESLPKLGYTLTEARSITGLGRTTLWKAIANGELGCFKIGRRILFSLPHLEEFMKLKERPMRARDQRTTPIPASQYSDRGPKRIDLKKLVSEIRILAVIRALCLISIAPWATVGPPAL